MKRSDIQNAYQYVKPDEDSRDRMLSQILLSSEISPAGKGARMMRKKVKPIVLVAVIVLTVAMAVTVSASEVVSSWLKQYFEKRNDGPLSSEQIQYIEENEQIIQDTQSKNGYSFSLKSLMADDNIVYITLGVTAPKALPFDKVNLISLDGFDFYDHDMNRPASSTIRVIDDMDGLDTTADILLELSDDSWNYGELWTLHIEKLATLFYDEEYEKRLLSTKYAGQDDVTYTDKEIKKIYQQTTMADGPWEFTIDMSMADGECLQFKTESITVTGHGYEQPGGNEFYEELLITAVDIRPLGVTIYTEITESRVPMDIHTLDKEQFVVMMKDGSAVELNSDWSVAGEAHFIATTPIVLKEVDHILFPDGTKIIVP